jgi:Kef-type K+ transport system membrane component KefB
MILVVSVVLSIGLGYVFHLLTEKKTSEQDLLVYLLGLVFFVSGAAFYFNLSPLFTGMVLGITYSNLTRIHEKLYPLLLSTEKPLYIVFLILIGALWRPDLDWRIAVMVGSLICMRIVGLFLPLPFLGKVLGFQFKLRRKLGFCLLSSGSIGIAYAVSVKLAFPIPLTDTFLSAALFAVIISELFSPLAALRSLNILDKEE